jgi:ABC-2 type transport system ATP-binding protein
MNGLQINNLNGGYPGNQVLHDVSFNVPAGQIIGLIGLNGAGKSTTIAHVIDELRPLSGTIAINGVATQQPDVYRQMMAYIPEQPILYPELTLREHLTLLLSAYQVDVATKWPEVEALLVTFRLADKLHWLPTHFSKGMKQKVMLVAALMLDVPLLIVDEPFVGLDALAMKDLVNLLTRKAEQGTAILLTTHLLQNAANFVDGFVWLDQGAVKFTGSADALAQHYNVSPDNLDGLFDQSHEVRL